MSVDLNDRIAPRSVEAERNALGAALISEAAAIELASRLKPTDFYLPGHQYIYEAIQELAFTGKPGDTVMVGERLKQRQRLDECGGMVYLESLTDDCDYWTHVIEHAEVVADRSARRNVIRLGSDMMGWAYAGDTATTELIGRALADLIAIGEVNGREFHVLHDLLKEVTDDVQKGIDDPLAATEETVPVGIETMQDGFQVVVHKGEYVLLAARPSVGKTSLGTQVAVSAARAGIGVAFFSMEMTANALARRFAQQGHGCAIRRVSESNFSEFMSSVADIPASSIWVYDRGESKAEELALHARRAVARRDWNIGLIIVDYLQIIRSARRHEGIRVETTEISRVFKLLAQQTNVPVIALCQLSRQLEESSRRPRLHDLRESGALEADADKVWFLWQPREEEEKPDSRYTEFIQAKNRNGPRGKCYMIFHPSSTRFTPTSAPASEGGVAEVEPTKRGRKQRSDAADDWGNQ